MSIRKHPEYRKAAATLKSLVSRILPYNHPQKKFSEDPYSGIGFECAGKFTDEPAGKKTGNTTKKMLMLAATIGLLSNCGMKYTCRSEPAVCSGIIRADQVGDRLKVDYVGNGLESTYLPINECKKDLTAKIDGCSILVTCKDAKNNDISYRLSLKSSGPGSVFPFTARYENTEKLRDWGNTYSKWKRMLNQ